MRGGPSYQPMMAVEAAQRIREWHERAYQQARLEGAQEQTFDYLGRVIVVPPGVQPVAGMAHVLGRAVLDEVQPGDRVLDMGTGSGVNAILAAAQANSVLAVDINPQAVQTAQANAERNGVSDRVVARRSDVFSDVDGEFDLIIFDPPFRWFDARDQLELATTDPGYRALTTFFDQAAHHLTSRGRILLTFGTSGDIAYLQHLITHHDYDSTVVAHDHLERDTWHVDYYTFRLVPNDR
jgi:release factor glutamine methyltransferase